MRIKRQHAIWGAFVAAFGVGVLMFGCSSGPQSLNPQPLPPGTDEPGQGQTPGAGGTGDNGSDTAAPNAPSSDGGEGGADGGTE